jgi:hypothetical protein
MGLAAIEGLRCQRSLGETRLTGYAANEPTGASAGNLTGRSSRLAPDFLVFSQRIVLDPNWLGIMKRGNLTLETRPIERITTCPLSSPSGSAPVAAFDGVRAETGISSRESSADWMRRERESASDREGFANRGRPRCHSARAFLGDGRSSAPQPSGEMGDCSGLRRSANGTRIQIGGDERNFVRQLEVEPNSLIAPDETRN